MVTDLFGTLLQELGVLLNLPNLHPDQNNTCLIKLKQNLSVQLELDRMGQFLVVGADLGTVPTGKFRENFFREALKANGMPFPLYGIFAYSQKTDHLIIYEKLSVKDLTGEKVQAFLTPFVEKALVWKQAIERNEIPLLVQHYGSGSQRAAGLFGLMP